MLGSYTRHTAEEITAISPQPNTGVVCEGVYIEGLGMVSVVEIIDCEDYVPATLEIFMKEKRMRKAIFLASTILALLVCTQAQAQLEPHRGGDGPMHDELPPDTTDDDDWWVYGPYGSLYTNCNFGSYEGDVIFGCDDYWSGGTQHGTLSIDYDSCDYNGPGSMLQNCPSSQPDTEGNSPTWDCTQSSTDSSVHVCNQNDP